MPIIVKHLTLYNQEKNRMLLQDINCTIPTRGITLLLGRTGAGKSTLIEALSGLAAYDEGAIYYGDQPLWIKKGRINRNVQLMIGTTFQLPEQQLFAKTVQGEFDYSLRPYRIPRLEILQRTARAMHAFGIENSLRLKSPHLLSGGQKRRVAMATTLSTQPTWLLLDEPTAGLDCEGSQQLVETLIQWKEEMTEGGIVIATHDLDTLLPLADHVLILRNGSLLSSMSQRDLVHHTDILENAGVGKSAAMELNEYLRKNGFHINEGLHTPRQLAEQLSIHVKNKENIKHSMHHHLNEADQKRTDRKDTQHQSQIFNKEKERFIQTVDPRAKWIFYMTLSTGILLQQQWTGLLSALLLTIGVVGMTRVPFRKMIPILTPFFVLMLVSFVLSGIRLDGSFDYSDALISLFRLTQILLVMGLGIWLSLTTSSLNMKKGLESLFQFLRWIRLPVEAMALAASLVLRFIPLLMKEVDRFSKIVKARGKKRSKIGALGFKELPAVMIPFILSLLQLGSNLSLALESRGYKRVGIERTSAYPLKLQFRDYAMILSGMLGLMMLIYLM